MSDTAVETFDVIIVGAGISGIGSAWYLQRDCPAKSFVVLEAMETFGGTWHTHRIPARARTATSTPSATASSRGTEQPVATRERILPITAR